MERPWPTAHNHTQTQPAGRLILIRHPQTEANAAHLLQGSTDSPLTQLGAAQLRSLAETFAAWSEDDLPHLIIHSPLSRCKRLAAAVADGVTAARKDARRGRKAAPRPYLSQEQSDLCDTSPRQSTASSSRVTLDSGRPDASECDEEGIDPADLLLPSRDLQERDFGSMECTRRGTHAGPRFPRVAAGVKRESDDAFRTRVRRSGMVWMRKACELRERQDRAAARGSKPNTLRATTDAATELEINQCHGVAYEGSSSGTNDKAKESASDDEIAIETGTGPPQVCSVPPLPPPPPSSKAPPVIVLVTHGLWISTFFQLFPPCEQNGSVLGRRPPFASNTGMFLVDVLLPTPTPTPTPTKSVTATGATPGPAPAPKLRPDLAPSSSSSSTSTQTKGPAASPAKTPSSKQQQQPFVRLVRANWTPHLQTASSTTGKAAAAAAGEPKSKQRRLDSFFTRA
ncbi:unnamed protein product [Parajaminaea phylloscopi]